MLADRNGKPGGAADTIEAIRLDLLGEHLGMAPSDVRAHFEETGSLIATIEQLRGEGRSLKPLEPAARPGLLRRVRRGRLHRAARPG